MSAPTTTSAADRGGRCDFGTCARDPACTRHCAERRVMLEMQQAEQHLAHHYRARVTPAPAPAPGSLQAQAAIAAYTAEAEAGEAQRREAQARELASIDAQARLLAWWVAAVFALLIAAYAFGPELLLWLARP